MRRAGFLALLAALGTGLAARAHTAELALRLKYAGVAPERLAVVDDLEHGLDQALAAGSGPLYALPTYTALLELKDLLARRGDGREYSHRKRRFVQQHAS